MKTNDFDLGQKVKFLHFLIWNDNSTGGKFFLYMKSGLKVKRRRKKRVNSREKKLQKIFCLAASTQGEEMTLIKVAYFMLKFLNLQSKPIHLFWGVASSLSILCHRIRIFNTLMKCKLVIIFWFAKFYLSLILRYE